MLQKIHDKLSGWVAYFILGVLAVVFVFWGIDFGFSASRYAAKVKVESRPWWQPAEKIPVEAVRQAWQNQSMQFQQMYRGELPEELRSSLQRRLLEEFVRNEVLTQHSHDLGYRVSEAQVLGSYESIPAFQIDGKFSRDAALSQMKVQGMSPAQFETEQRAFLQVAQLQQALAQSSFVTPAELEVHRRLQQEQREASWLILPAEKFSDAVRPDEEAIKAFYEKNQDRYMTAETVALRYVELSLEELVEEVQVAEGEDRMEAAEQRFGELQEELADEAFENLNDLDAVAAALGLKIKEVPVFSRATGGGGLGARPDIIEAAFSEAVLNGENSRPIELLPGHVVVLRASAHRAAEPKPLAAVRAEVVEAIKKEQSEQQARDLAQRSAALMQEGRETLERLAKEFKTEPQGPRFIGRTDEAMPIELRNALFATPRPANSGESLYRPVTLGSGDAAVLKFSGVRLNAEEETPEQREARADQLRQQKAQTEIGAYVAQLQSDAYVVRNAEVFE